jgi:preprotein translocase subunit SecD
VGKVQLLTLRLDGPAFDNVNNADRKNLVEAGLKSGEPFLVDGCLYYARPITSWQSRPKKDRDQGKTREFFVLLRQEGQGKEVSGDLLERTSVGRDSRDRPCIDFWFSDEGGERFYDLTSRNKPAGEDGFRRQLAIVFDNQVMSAPSLISPIRKAGQITGEFTTAEVEDYVRILRAGALPARLKPDPVRVRKVEPKR